MSTSQTEKSEIIYENNGDKDPKFRPFNLDLLIRLLKVSLFHYSFGLILLSSMKQLFTFSLSIYNPFVFFCLFQSLIAAIYQLIISYLDYQFKKKKVIEQWSEQVIVITGGANGFGWLLAQCFVQRFATVIVLDILEPANPQAGIYFHKCDVTDYKQVEKVLKEIKEEFGVPTILINNAGIIQPKLLVDSDIKDIERTLNVNLLSNFYTTKIVLPWMLQENFGHIVTISSILGHTSPAQATAYAASKAGLIAFHESLTQELTTSYSDKSIKTLLLVPGQMDTGMFNGVEQKYPFLFPMTDSLELIEKLFLYLEYHHNGEIYAPFYTNLGPLARCFPLSFRSWVYTFTGANCSLNNWMGHLRDKNKVE
ncbi:NAD(P)-binding protein [Neoconidiobolus thromboides FSU 785]|nr:NAD(P)-binding protein [Neoconidiobolus thromboides FSU 785]